MTFSLSNDYAVTPNSNQIQNPPTGNAGTDTQKIKMHYSNQIQQTLNNFAERGIELRIQYCNEDGKQVPRIQATGTGIMLSSDWELLRRNKPKIVRHLESTGAIDASFGEYVESKPIERTVESVSAQSLKESAARIASSDARARESRKTAQEAQKREKEAVARERTARTGTARKPRENIWTKQQDSRLCELFIDYDKWPIRQAPSERKQRIGEIVFQIGELGYKRTWQGILRRIVDLRKLGLMSERGSIPAKYVKRPSRSKKAKVVAKPRKIKAKKPKRIAKPKPLPMARKNGWTAEQDAFIRVLRWPVVGGTPEPELKAQICSELAKLGPKRTWLGAKKHRNTMLLKNPLTQQEALEFQRLNVRVLDRQKEYEESKKQRRAGGAKPRLRLTTAQKTAIRSIDWHDMLVTAGISRTEAARRKREFLDMLSEIGPRICWNTAKNVYFRTR